MTETHALPFSPACERNKQPIAEVLDRLLEKGARVLEIGAGTGQHAVHFARLRPDLYWQATDVAGNLPGLKARLAREAGPQLPPPIALDVRDRNWPEGPFDAVYTANTLHIMPFELTGVLLERSAQLLQSGGCLICYGPFQDNGMHTADSNRAFDQSLRQRDPAMGVRDTVEIYRLARAAGFEPEEDIAMPANNRVLVVRRG
jgi:cyclopropane fatty-acyl-phospholipid synthase-like methyltransferase